jgi:peptidoglycan/LPS O-acetylase OafA/YrhL
VSRRPAGGHGRITFANQLRGLAFLSVMLSHLGGVFVLMGPLVAWVTSMPQVHAGLPAILWLTNNGRINLGALGVSVFFLISGFVIPFSLAEQGRAAFLLSRFFRIFPTFWAALAIEAALVFVQGRIDGLGMAFTPADYLANASLTDTIIGHGFVDLVNWTLSIEVKFYLLMAVLRGAVLAGRVWLFPLVSMAAILIGLAQQHGLLPVSDLLAAEPVYLGYMLIGTVLHLRMVGRIGTVGATLAVFGLLLPFVVGWRIGPLAAEFTALMPSYLLGLTIFACCYGLRRLFRPVRLLDWLAGLSYPLYLIHSVVGYSVMALAMHMFGFGYWGALLLAMGCLVVVATGLHRLVELPSTRFGKRLARRLAAGRSVIRGPSRLVGEP